MLLYTPAVCVLVPLILFYLSYAISRHTSSQSDYFRPFECGFERFSSARVPFSLKFYLVVVIFLVFDLEVVILIPIPETIISLHNYNVANVVTVIIVLLILGLLLEWCDGATT